MMKKYKKITIESGFSLVVVFLLAIIALDIIFVMPSGLIAMSSGIILILGIIGLIVLLMIYVKLCELSKK